MSVINSKNIIGIGGCNSFLAHKFIKKNQKIYIIKKYTGDINNHHKFRSWIKKNQNLNYFINFAAKLKTSDSKKNINKLFQTNYSSVIKLMNIINSNKLKKFNYFLAISSSHVFKNTNYKLKEESLKKPRSNYGKSKLKMENYIIKNYKKYYFKIGIARVFNYYNLNNKHNFINDVLHKLKDNNNIVKFNKVDTYRDFTHVDDVVSGINQMIKFNLIKDYNICSGNKIYLKKIIYYLNKKIKNKIIVYIGGKTKNLVGSNIKLQKTGWKCKKVFDFKKII